MDIELLYSFEKNVLNIIGVFLIVKISLIHEHHINICYSSIPEMSTPHCSFSLRYGSNFLEWYRNLRIVLKQEKKDYVLENVLPEKPKTNVQHTERNAYDKHVSDRVDVCCLMLATMNSYLQRQYENVDSPIDMITSLKGMFQEQARTERYQTVKSLIECKLPIDGPVSPDIIKMMGYIDNLAKLDCPISQELATDLILQSLPSSYDQFVMNYNMNNLTKTLTELHGMLKQLNPTSRRIPQMLLWYKRVTSLRNKVRTKERVSQAGLRIQASLTLLLSLSLVLLMLISAIIVMALDIGKETVRNT
ncbi:hypothetical protein YC2023_116227 [Brassica napus]